MLINEVIEAPLYTTARDAILEKLKEWVPYWIYSIDMQIDEGEYYNIRKELINKSVQTGDNSFYEQASEMQHKRYDVVSRFLNEARQQQNDLFLQMIQSLKFMLEGVLAKTAKDYIRDRLGDYLESYGLSGWLNRNALLVDINYKAQYKSGQPRTGGGYYQNSPTAGEFTDQRSQGLGKGDLAVARGIKIYAKKDDLWNAAYYTILHQLAQQMFGDSEPDHELSSLLEQILPTFTHETVHLEQSLRKHVIGGNTSGLGGLSYTPIPGKQRPKIDRQTNMNQSAKFRGGRRGDPSRLGNEENTTPEEWTEYFGTDHEIEAHAAGAAAAIVHDAVRNANSYSYGSNVQARVNEYIDEAISDLQSGFLPSNHHSLKDYWKEIRQNGYRLLKYRKWQDERALNKINIGARKVWTIFVRKLIKHLQAYKKPVPTYSERDPRLRTPALPKPQLPG